MADLSMERVAILGIGAMGHGLANSALRAGIPTTVWNRAPEATRDLAELGAEVAAGSRLKLVNNTWLAFTAEAVGASVALARRLGLETEAVVDALTGGPLVSPWQAGKLERIAKGEFSAQFALSLALKDVRLALEAAGDDRFAALAALADEWQRGVDQGLGDHDLTVVTRALEQHAAAT